VSNYKSGDDNKTNLNVTFIVAVFTLIASVTASYFTMRSDAGNVDSANIQSFMSAQIKVNSELMLEIKNLKGEVTKAIEGEERWRMRYIEVSLEKLEVERLLNEKISEAEILESWMDDMPFAAWAKKRGDDGIFYLVAINDRFTSRYGLTKANAIGRTDLELFPEEYARQYMLDDEKVASSGKPYRGTVDYQSPTGLVKMKHIKYRMNFPNGDVGVAGMVID
jgi:hypothetical protein